MQFDIIKNVHDFFNTITEYEVIFDTNYDKVEEFESFIKLKYFPNSPVRVVLGKGDYDKIFKDNGILRIFIYAKNITELLKIQDYLIASLNEKVINNIYYKNQNKFVESTILDNSTLNKIFVDFEVCLKK